MMKKNVLFLTSLILLGAAAFTSCEKDDVDNEKPVIRLIAPEEDEEIRPGSDIHFDVEFSDNVALGSYKVNIHWGEDHTHSATLSTRAEEEGEPFERPWLEKEFIALGDEPIAGKRSVTVHHHHIVIPETITVDGVEKPIKEGHYHFMVHCIDEAGLETFVAREIVISSEADEHDHHH